MCASSWRRGKLQARNCPYQKHIASYWKRRRPRDSALQITARSSNHSKRNGRKSTRQVNRRKRPLEQRRTSGGARRILHPPSRCAENFSFLHRGVQQGYLFCTRRRPRLGVG